MLMVVVGVVSLVGGFGSAGGGLLMMDIAAALIIVTYHISRHQTRPEQGGDWDECPYCKNPIHAGATRCQHCHADLDE